MTSLELIDSVLILKGDYKVEVNIKRDELFIYSLDTMPFFIVRLKDYSYVKHVGNEYVDCKALESLINYYSLTPIKERGLDELEHWINQGGKRGKNY